MALLFAASFSFEVRALTHEVNNNNNKSSTDKDTRASANYLQIFRFGTRGE